ncbi:MAG: 1,4-alpha-glucan branching protein GlgB [Sporomusaceae bacterium]|nr:1,4-alpha-glucan branching protein GlgB [Sporomusaceae bacterium]
MHPFFSEAELYLFNTGRNFSSYRTLGAHLVERGGVSGVRFAVWAPHAEAVSVVGDFNQWRQESSPLHRQGESGVWAGFVPGLAAGTIYKYAIRTADGWLLKADPFAFFSEKRPKSASVVSALDGYSWRDADWQSAKNGQLFDKPVTIYEVHLGSWRQGPDGEPLSYRELAAVLPGYAAGMGYTHIELLPLAEHPFDGSWGYQATGYYAVTSRYGSPEQFMEFVDACHACGLGVILDWVPGHFCNDGHGLKLFDGAPLFESEQRLRAENRQWGTTNFDFERSEVWSFLISNAIFWLERYHIDGLRVDAVANLLYLDYGREPGEWEPNHYGGRENLAAIAFLRKLHEAVFERFPHALMFAEESTAWPLVTAPVYSGGLGFNYKWNMGWMNDMLRYMETDPLQRKWRHDKLTFSLLYAFSENFVLPLSHDEVVHGKKSLLDKMPGDYWQKFANLRAFYAYMAVHPGKKLLFMGGEFGQFIEWNEAQGLDWHLLDYELHQKLQLYVRALNHYYLDQPCLWEQDQGWEGFEWINCGDSQHSVISLLRRDRRGQLRLVVVNFTPVMRSHYRVGVPVRGRYQEEFNSDASEYGGSGAGNSGIIRSEPVPWDGRQHSLVITLPPLAAVILAPLLAEPAATGSVITADCEAAGESGQREGAG